MSDRIQNCFHDELTVYINKCAFSRGDMILSAVSRQASCLLNASRIRKNFATLSGSLHSATEPTPPVTLHIPVYTGSNKYVIRMMQALLPLEDSLYGAYVHGSLGSGEEVTYSDFDALLILRDSAFEASGKLSRLASRLSSLQRIMLEFDPLQHHGWFVLTESDLKYYCDAYFPKELFPHARSLLKVNGTVLELTVRNSAPEVRDVFDRVVDSIVRKTSADNRPDNLFRLKALLSEFMLLPALYLHARYGTGVFKKDCYEKAETDFSGEQWQVMHEVSAIRSSWPALSRSKIAALFSLNLTLRNVLSGRLSPPIPPELGKFLTQDFYLRIHDLAVLMREKVS